MPQRIPSAIEEALLWRLSLLRHVRTLQRDLVDPDSMMWTELTPLQRARCLEAAEALREALLTGPDGSPPGTKPPL